MPEPKFKRGDLVKHKTSGQRGVIVCFHKSCVKHRPFESCFMRLDRSDCDIQFNGVYQLNTGFDQDEIDVAEYLLELYEQGRR